MLNVNPFSQSTGFCGPACLKMVFSYYGIEKSEKRLADLSGCTKARGTRGENLVRAAKKAGLKGFLKDSSSISDIRRYVLKKQIPVIVNWFCQDEGHYSVVVDIDKENIYLQDPQLGHVRAMRIGMFKNVWFDFKNGCPHSKDDLIIRRIIVIYP